jgi:hypothetical protein
MNRFEFHKLIWAARFLIGTVLFFNLQCAFVFLFWPDVYTADFELTGAGGIAAVQGMGLLFVMWNIPYMVAIIDPLHYWTSLVEAVCMQAVGVGGEIILALGLPSGHPVLLSGIQRFILFDTVGLLCLLAAWALVSWHKALKVGQEAG